jgi:flagellar protein FliO/FliZ
VIELLLRITFSLLVVLGLMWGLARLARRPLNRRMGAGGGALAVLARAQLSRNASVAVVRVADRALVVGVTDAAVNLLGEADLAGVTEALDEPVVRRRPVALDRPGTRPGSAPAPGSDREPHSGAPRGALQGSLLSPATWAQTVDFLRERTARH